MTSISDNYKATYVHYSIKDDSLSLYIDGKIIKSLSDSLSSFKTFVSEGHIWNTFIFRIIKPNSRKIRYYSETNKVEPQDIKVKIHDLNGETRKGKYFEFGQSTNLLTKGYFELLDSVRIDTIALIDYDTFEETYDLKMYDSTWYRSGIWKYFDDEGLILKYVSYSDSLARMSNHFWLEY